MDWKDTKIKRKSLILQVPNISKAEETGKAVEAARFHPGGNRGVQVCKSSQLCISSYY